MRDENPLSKIANSKSLKPRSVALSQCTMMALHVGLRRKLMATNFAAGDYQPINNNPLTLRECESRKT